MEIKEDAAFPDFDSDSLRRNRNLWVYTDARDGAQCIRRALETAFLGFKAFIAANTDGVMIRPNTELRARVFPDVLVKRPLDPHETLLLIDKAERLPGYQREQD